MTTTVTISDSEKIALKAALEMMIEHCEDQIVAGEGAPYWSYRLKSSEFVSDFSMSWRDANDRRPIAR